MAFFHGMERGRSHSQHRSLRPRTDSLPFHPEAIPGNPKSSKSIKHEVPSGIREFPVLEAFFATEHALSEVDGGGHLTLTPHLEPTTLNLLLSTALHVTSNLDPKTQKADHCLSGSGRTKASLILSSQQLDR